MSTDYHESLLGTRAAVFGCAVAPHVRRARLRVDPFGIRAARRLDRGAARRARLRVDPFIRLARDAWVRFVPVAPGDQTFAGGGR